MQWLVRPMRVHLLLLRTQPGPVYSYDSRRCERAFRFLRLNPSCRYFARTPSSMRHTTRDMLLTHESFTRCSTITGQTVLKHLKMWHRAAFRSRCNHHGPTALSQGHLGLEGNLATRAFANNRGRSRLRVCTVFARGNLSAGELRRRIKPGAVVVIRRRTERRVWYARDVAPTSAIIGAGLATRSH